MTCGAQPPLLATTCLRKVVTSAHARRARPRCRVMKNQVPCHRTQSEMSHQCRRVSGTILFLRTTAPEKPELAEGQALPSGQHWSPAQLAEEPGQRTESPTLQC